MSSIFLSFCPLFVLQILPWHPLQSEAAAQTLELMPHQHRIFQQTAPGFIFPPQCERQRFRQIIPLLQQVIDNLMNYITPADYEAAKAYVADPEVFDFKKILNW